MPDLQLDLDALASFLDVAQQTTREIDQLSPGLTIDDAYAVQAALVARRLERGEQATGAKLGFTNRAKMEQMGVDTVIVGRLTDAMAIPDGGTVAVHDYIHARVEPEVVFRLGRDVAPGEDVASAVDAVAAGLEIIDSRFRDFRFTTTDVIADNTSAAGYVVGAWQPLPPPAAGSLAGLDVELVVDGGTVERATTSAILGDPVEALRSLTALAAEHGIALRAGDVVLAGAATTAVPLHDGDVEARIARIGSVRLHVVHGRHAPH